MTDVLHDTTPQASPTPRRTSSLVSWLAGGLALALLAVVGLAAYVYLDRSHNRLTSAQSAAVEAVDRNIDALNSNDLTLLAPTMTTDVVWTAVGAGAVGEGPYVGQKYLDFMSRFSPTFSLQPQGEPVVGGDTVVAVPTRLSFGAGDVAADGVTVFTVRDDAGTLKVSEIVWIPEASSR